MQLNYIAIMHPAGFEPAMSLWEADYESDAFGHLAIDAILELVGLEPTSIYIFETILYLTKKQTDRV